MSDRHEILQDEQFWLVLEFGLSGWFRTCGNKSLGGFWCDGFTPHLARNTREGIEVTGDAWIVAGQEDHHKCSFTASIPQRMLTKNRKQFVIAELALDLEHRDLRFAVTPASEPPNR